MGASGQHPAEGEPRKDRQRLLYRAFQNAEAYLDDLFSVYRSLYSLETVCYKEQLADKTLFEYCLARKYYILVIPYTDDGNLLVERVFAFNRLSWGIIGGGLKPVINDNFVNAVQRNIERFVSGMVLGEIEPIAFLDNEFRFEDQVHHHLGIAFVARIRNSDPKNLLAQAPNSRCFLVPSSLSSEAFGLRHHKAVIELAAPRMTLARRYATQEDEISANSRYRGRYRFHGAVVKPVFRVLSKLYKHSIGDLNRRMDSIITERGCAALLDVACGENLSIVDLAHNETVSLVVGNDISWSQVELLGDAVSVERLRNLKSFVLFTNHDARRLPFADKAFDCVVCKNVLHHMPDQDSVVSLIREMRRVGKRALIVEVLDPRFEGRWGRLRHRYYIDFLKDAGVNFLSEPEFDELTNFPNRTQRFNMETIRGIYQFAVFSDEVAEQ